MTETSGGVSGTCDERFGAVRAAFERNFENGSELGASVAIVDHDELVVDLWGGLADVSRTTPWAQDTLVMVASTSKVVVSIGAVLANSGTRHGERFLSEEGASLAWQEQRHEYDLVMEAPVRWGLGFGLASEEVPLPFPRSVHCGGYGGSIFTAEPDSQTSWCYTPNRFVSDREGDEQATPSARPL